MKKVYNGLLIYVSNGEEDELLGLLINNRVDNQPLADIIRGDMYTYGDNLTVRYYISDVKLSPDRLQEEFMKTLMGHGDIDYYVSYSEITGYLWTDEEIKVGGHDLLNELKNNIGRWLYMEIDYNE